VIIRRATPQDAEAVARIQVDTWRAAYRGLVPDAHLDQMSVERSTARHREALTEGRFEAYLAWEAGEAVGFVGVGSCRDEDVNAERVGEIWGIYVLLSHWGRRVGARLYRFAEQILRARGFSTVVLWVFAGNASARRFYEAMGYAPDGTSKILEVGKPLEAIRYRREL